MNLYSLSIQEPTTITHLAQGSLLSSKSQDLILVRGSQIIELFNQSKKTDQLELVLRNDTFSQVRNVMTYRPVGNLKDYLVICSDSGKLTIVEHVKDEFERSSLRVIVQETMCKSGCRRIAPGEFLAKDPKGRAIILASTEKNKLIYLTSKSSTSDDFVISSPLEANKANTLVLDMVGLNVGFENPLFVCLEIDYGEVDDPSAPVVTGEPKKMLTFYEIDLGLNHVIKKKSFEVDSEASMVLAIGENPKLEKGVLMVASQNIYYYDLKGNKINQMPVPTRFDLLRTEGSPDAHRLGDEESQNGLLFLSKAFCKYKNENFYLLQNEWGDIFKITIRTGNQLGLDYFCTSRVSTDMCIFKTGFLFLANEAADHQLLAIHGLEPVEGLRLPFKMPNDIVEKELYIPIPLEKADIFVEVQSLANLGGLSCLKYEDLYGDDIGQIYAITGGVNGSNLSVMRHAVQTQGSIKLQMPFNPDSLFTLPQLAGDPNLKEFLIIGYEKRTFMLKRNQDQMVQAPLIKGFMNDTSTLYADVLDITVGINDQGDPKKARAYLQVHGAGLRIIFKNDKFLNWECEDQKTILRATSIENQILLFLSTRELVYFLFEDGRLREITRASLSTDIMCMTLFVKENLRQHSTFAVIGFRDKSVRVFSLERDLCLMKMSSQFLPAVPEKIVIQHSHVLTALSNGVLCRTHIDELTGALSEARTRVMTDGQPLKMYPVKVDNREAVILSGNKHYLGYFDGETGKFELQHLIIDSSKENVETLKELKFVINFQDDQMIIVDVNSLLKICKVSIPKTGFTSKKKKLELMGRRLLINAEHQNLIVVQSENRRILNPTKTQLVDHIKTSLELDSPKIQEVDLDLLRFGAKPSTWESRISIINPITLEDITSIQFKPDEHILETQLLTFKGADNETFLLVSVACNHDVLTNKFTSSRVDLYVFEGEGAGLSLFHSTRMDGLVTAAAGFKGKLLMGVNGYMRTYELGIKQLLKKGEYKHQYGVITSIRISNDRVYMGDSRNSVHLLRYKDGELTELADDVLPRFLSSFDLLDHHTVALVDKFGNFSILRIPPDSEQELSEDFMTYKFKWENGYLNGAPVKFDQLCAYYFQTLQTSIQKVTFISSQEDVLLMGDIHGSIRLMIPFEFKAELDFFKHLELYLRLPQDGYPFLTDRDHLLFRSYHASSRGVIDGNLCEQFIDLNETNQGLIAQNLDRTKGEIIKKLEDFRFKII